MQHLIAAKRNGVLVQHWIALSGLGEDRRPLCAQFLALVCLSQALPYCAVAHVIPLGLRLLWCHEDPAHVVVVDIAVHRLELAGHGAGVSGSIARGVAVVIRFAYVLHAVLRLVLGLQPVPVAWVLVLDTRLEALSPFEPSPVTRFSVDLPES